MSSFDKIANSLMQYEPGWEYGTLLPFRRNEKTREREWALPSIAKEAVRGVTSFGRAASGQMPDDPKQQIAEALNAAGMMQLGGAGAARVTPAAQGQGVVGTIRSGGQKDLLLSHETSLDNLARMLTPPSKKTLELWAKVSPEHAKRLWQEYRNSQVLDAPSMAISRFEKPFSGRSDAVLYPNPTLLDPAVNPRSKLYGNDVFTYRRSYGQRPGYLRDPWAFKDPRFTENSLPATYSHLGAVLEAKEFPSFKAFETDPRGANLLMESRPGYQDYSLWDDQFRKELSSWLKSKGHRHDFIDNWQPGTQLQGEDKAIVQNFLNDPKNQIAKEFTQYLPVGYAELKYQGQLPLSKPQISALGVEGGIKTLKKEYPELVRALMQRGISVVDEARSRDITVDILDRLHGLQGK